MKQTILIEANEDLRKIFAANLNNLVGTDVIYRTNAEDTIELLKILPQIGLIITQSKVGAEETAIKINAYVKSEGLEAKMLIMGNCPELEPELICLKEPVSWETIVREAANKLGISPNLSKNKRKFDYQPVSVHYFYEITRTPCDIYIRIKKGPNEFQYVRRLQSKDVFDKSAIRRYEDQGLRDFYVTEEDHHAFTTFVANNLIQKLEKEDLELEDRILLNANAHGIVREALQLATLDDTIVGLSEASINSMAKSVKDSPRVGVLIALLFSNKISYAYQHCHLLALMCHYILSKQSWYRPEHLETLSFASFFSDVTLTTTPQMQVLTMQDLMESTLSDSEKSQVMSHARDAADIVSLHPESNDFINTVLMQSHGKLDGVGLEDNPTEDLHPLSKIFVVADAFIKILMNPEQPSTKGEILPILALRFTNPSYQKIIRALEQKFE